MIYNSISDYIQAKEDYNNTRWLISENGNFAFINGQWMEETKFNQLYSKPTYEPPVLENPDGTHLPGGAKVQKRQK